MRSIQASYLAVDKKVAASTQNLAFNTLLFMFNHVLVYCAVNNGTNNHAFCLKW